MNYVLRQAYWLDRLLRILREIEGGLGEAGGAAKIAPIILVGSEGEDLFALRREAEIGGDDREDAFFGEHGEETRGNDVDSGESKSLERNRREISPRRNRSEAKRSRFARNDRIFVVDAAAAELEVVVEKERAGSFAGLDGEGGKGVIFFVELDHAAGIDGADDVDVVEEEGIVHLMGIVTFAGGRVLEKKPGGFFQAAARVQQNVFAGNFDAHAEVFVGFQIVDDHVGEMVDVDDDFGYAEGAQAREGDFEKRAAGEFDEGFGAIVGERAEAGAKAGGEDHGFH